MEFRNNSPERSRKEMPSSPRQTDGSVLVRLKDLERGSGRGVGSSLHAGKRQRRQLLEKLPG